MSLTSYRAAPPRAKPKYESSRKPEGRAGRPGGDLLFRALRRSTIGAEGFHGRVRDGIGCFAPRYGHQADQTAPRRHSRTVYGLKARYETQPLRAFGEIRHLAIVCFWFLPLNAALKCVIERLVPVSCTGYPASTSGLSTWSSTTALSETWF